MKGKTMRLLAIALAAVLLMSLVPSALAETGDTGEDTTGSVNYTSGQTFLYDLAPVASLFNFKNVMPGDVRTANIEVDNTNGRDVLVYLRAMPKSESKLGFLQQLSFSVSNGANAITPPLTTGFSNWPNAEGSHIEDSYRYVELGRVNSGQSVTLTLQMNVPITMGNEYQLAQGDIVWVLGITEIVPWVPEPPDEPNPTPGPYFPPIPLGPPVSVDEIPLGPYSGDDDGTTKLLLVCVVVVALVLAGTVYLSNRSRKNAKRA